MKSGTIGNARNCALVWRTDKRRRTASVRFPPMARWGRSLDRSQMRNRPPDSVRILSRPPVPNRGRKRSPTEAALLLSVYLKLGRHFRWNGARRTGHTGGTAAAGASAVPRAVGMGFTNPSRVVAGEALYGLTHGCPSNEKPPQRGYSYGGFWPSRWEALGHFS
jgi:hypothetical protein